MPWGMPLPLPRRGLPRPSCEEQLGELSPVSLWECQTQQASGFLLGFKPQRLLQLADHSLDVSAFKEKRPPT